MKIVAPPTISNLQQIIDLLLNPSKYAKYLQDLQSMLAAIEERLVDLDTVEKIDEYIAQNDTKLRNAKQEYEAVLASIKASQDTAASLLNDAKQEAGNIVASANKLREEANNLKSRLENEVVVREKEVLGREKQLSILEAEYTSKSTKLVKDINEYNSKSARLSAALNREG